MAAWGARTAYGRGLKDVVNYNRTSVAALLGIERAQRWRAHDPIRVVKSLKLRELWAMGIHEPALVQNKECMLASFLAAPSILESFNNE